jgi:hypothetical protein
MFRAAVDPFDEGQCTLSWFSRPILNHRFILGSTSASVPTTSVNQDVGTADEDNGAVSDNQNSVKHRGGQVDNNGEIRRRNGAVPNGSDQIAIKHEDGVDDEALDADASDQIRGHDAAPIANFNVLSGNSIQGESPRAFGLISPLPIFLKDLSLAHHLLRFLFISFLNGLSFHRSCETSGAESNPKAIYQQQQSLCRQYMTYGCCHKNDGHEGCPRTHPAGRLRLYVTCNKDVKNILSRINKLFKPNIVFPCPAGDIQREPHLTSGYFWIEDCRANEAITSVNRSNETNAQFQVKVLRAKNQSPSLPALGISKTKKKEIVQRQKTLCETYMKTGSCEELNCQCRHPLRNKLCVKGIKFDLDKRSKVLRQIHDQFSPYKVLLCAESDPFELNQNGMRDTMGFFWIESSMSHDAMKHVEWKNGRGGLKLTVTECQPRKVDL